MTKKLKRPDDLTEEEIKDIIEFRSCTTDHKIQTLNELLNSLWSSPTKRMTLRGSRQDG